MPDMPDLKTLQVIWNYVNTLAGVTMLLSIGMTQIIKTWATSKDKELSSGKMKAISGAATFFGFYLLAFLAGYSGSELRTPANVINAVIAAVAGPYIAQLGKWGLAKYFKFDINTMSRIEDVVAKGPDAAPPADPSKPPESEPPLK